MTHSRQESGKRATPCQPYVRSGARACCLVGDTCGADRKGLKGQFQRLPLGVWETPFARPVGRYKKPGRERPWQVIADASFCTCA
eukprot:6296653-Amphidinium_carterae.1